MNSHIRSSVICVLSAATIAFAGTVTTSFADEGHAKKQASPLQRKTPSKNGAKGLLACRFDPNPRKKAHADGSGHDDDGDHGDHEHEKPGSKKQAGKGTQPPAKADDHDHDGDHKDHAPGEKKHGSKTPTKKGDSTHGKGGGHDDDDDHANEGKVKLTAKQLAQVKIISIAAGAGTVSRSLPLTAEVALNANRVSQVGASVSGRVVAIGVVAGERVKRGKRLAELHSQELAGLTANYLAARERLRIAKFGHAREKRLRDKNISSEQALLAAQEKLAVARITLQSIENKLHAIGLTNGELEKLAKSDGGAHRYSIVAPITGTIVQRSVGLGERVSPEKMLFRIADLRTVWVIASVYQSDLANVRVGQSAKVRIGAYKNRIFGGKVTWIADLLDEQTRTLKVRIEVDNKSRLLKPGMFANVDVVVSKKRFDLVIPASAIVRHRGETTVFVRTARGEFVRREITLGSRSSVAAQVTQGLKAGECIVTEGAFTLKSELDKGAFSDGHAH